MFPCQYEAGPTIRNHLAELRYSEMGASSLLLSGRVRESRAAAASGGALHWLERIAAGITFVGLAPGLGATMLAGLLRSGRSLLIAHRRLGLNGEPFWIVKLRTMWDRSPRQRTT